MVEGTYGDERGLQEVANNLNTMGYQKTANTIE